LIHNEAQYPAASEAIGQPEDSAPHILVVDDDRRLRQLLSRYLGSNGFRVSTASDAQGARSQLKNLEFDLLIVDVMMPGETGTKFTQSLRDEASHHASDVPILMLTALADTEERIQGLEVGADDYLTKPFDPRELLLRINSILKRTAKPLEPAIEQVSFGEFQFSVIRRELSNGGKIVRLTDREQEMLVIFASRPGETVARFELMDGENIAGERKIDVQINRLRRKLESDPSNPKWLQTVRGIGYRLCVE